MAAPLPEGAAFGEFLRVARERRGLTLQEIAAETKIPSRHLDALEHGNIAAVPTGLYRRGEIRAYAKAVGLDQGLALAELDHVLEAVPDLGPTPAARRGALEGIDGPVRTRVQFAIGVGLFLAAVLTLGTWRSEVVTSSIGASAVAEPDAPPAIRDEVTVPPAAEARPSSVPAPQPTRSVAPRTAGVVPAIASEPVSDVAPPEPATPVAPAEAELVVISEPPGARVTVNGIGWGSTPVTIRNLPRGELTVRVVQAGFISEQRVLRLAPGRRSTTVQIPLRPR